MDMGKRLRITAAFADLTKDQHIDLPMLRKHAEGALEAPFERALVECHLSVCDACFEKFEELLASVSTDPVSQGQDALEQAMPRAEESLALVRALARNHNDLVVRVAAVISGNKDLWLIREVLDAFEHAISETNTHSRHEEMTLQAAALTSGGGEGASEVVLALQRARVISTSVEDALARVPAKELTNRQSQRTQVMTVLRAIEASGGLDDDSLGQIADAFAAVLSEN